MPKKKEEKKETSKDDRKGSKKTTQFVTPDAGIQQLFLNLGGRALPLLAVLAAVAAASAAAGAPDSFLRSEVEQKMTIFLRFFFFLCVQAAATDFFVAVMLQAGRYLVGEGKMALTGTTAMPHEMLLNDMSIPWPPVDLLSKELRPYASKPATRPFSLNHVDGRKRCKDAMMRIGMNMGSFLCVWLLGRWLDNDRSLASLGLTLDGPFFYDSIVGFFVGVIIVAFMFGVELKAGWLHFLEFFQVFDRSDNFSKCIFWDVVFHLNVALNEELPVRGWMLFNLAEAFAAHWTLSPVKAVLYAMVFQSAFFVVMHLPSPGGRRWQSMTNIFVGGMAGGLNVLFTGGRLGFALGWHFGWNISMGNVFGLSTSGIPISATFVAVAPLPGKESLHGGVFGPEGGAVAPVAYLLGIVLCGLIYGVPDAAAVGAWLPSPAMSTLAAPAVVPNRSVG